MFLNSSCRVSTNKASLLPRYLSALVPLPTQCTITVVCQRLLFTGANMLNHKTSPGDLSDREGYDFGQIKSIAKVQVRSPFMF